MGGHASHGRTSDLAFMKRGYGEETVVWDSVVIGDFDSRNFHKVKCPWKVVIFRTNCIFLILVDSIIEIITEKG